MRKIIFQNLSITILSKILGFIAFIYIAKVLSTNHYGLLVYINLLLSILPLLQFGSMNGATILLPKYIAKRDGSEQILFKSYNNVSHLIQIVSVVVIFLLNIDISSFVLIIIALNYMLSKHIENSQILLSSNIEFHKLNVIKFFDQVLRPIATIVLFYYFKNLESIFISQLLVTIISFLISIIYVKFSLFGISFIQIKQVVKSLYKIGFIVYLIWAIDILFRTSDRWFISQFYKLDDLAAYGFVSSLSMNIWLLSISFFAPYSQLLYKHVAENNFLAAKNLIVSTNKKLYILLALSSVIAIAFYPLLIDFIIHKYSGTWLLFIALVMVSVLLSINNLFIYYLISNGLHFVLLKYQAIILFINLLLNSIFVLFKLDIIYFACSSIFALFTYFVLVRKCFFIDIEKKLAERLK